MIVEVTVSVFKGLDNLTDFMNLLKVGFNFKVLNKVVSGQLNIGEDLRN